MSSWPGKFERSGASGKYSSEEQWWRFGTVRKAMGQCSERERGCDPVSDCVLPAEAKEEGSRKE
jgi:hypothetical protein